MSFLLKHKFEFDKPFTHGVPYISRQEEQFIRNQWAELDKNAAQRATDSQDIEVKPQDEAFVQAIRDTINNWIESSDPEKDDFVNLPPPSNSNTAFPTKDRPLNAWQRRMVYQVVEKYFTGYSASSRAGGSFMQVQKQTKKREDRRRVENEESRERVLAGITDFRWVVEALVGGDISKLPLAHYRLPLSTDKRSSVTDIQLKEMSISLQKKVRQHKTVLVGHNMFLDVIYLYQCFLGDLPDKVEEFKTCLNLITPLVVDTKWLAAFKSREVDNTSLGDVEDSLRDEELPVTQMARGFTKYDNGDSYHEAGYDSYLTAMVAIKLSAKLKREQAEKEGVVLSLFGITPLVGTASDTTDEEYFTAPESSDEEASPAKSTGRPVDTIKSAANAVLNALPGKQTRSDLANATSAIRENMVGKRSYEQIQFMGSKDAERVRKDFAHTTIPDLQGKSRTISIVRKATNKGTPAKNKNNNRFADLMTFDNEEGDENESSSLEQKSANGEIMPRWEDKSFWQAFGNRLRVNASVEGVFDLQN